MPTGPTLSDAIVEIEKTIRDRCRWYPEAVAKNKLKQETADHKLAALRKAHDVLMFVERNETWIRERYDELRLAARRLAEPCTPRHSECQQGATLK